jgi:branched-subunit amino acid transport protein AzlD
MVSELEKGLALVVKLKSISGLQLLNISFVVLDFYLKIVPYIHFPVQNTDTKFQTVSQKNLGINWISILLLAPVLCSSSDHLECKP